MHVVWHEAVGNERHTVFIGTGTQGLEEYRIVLTALKQELAT